MELKDVRTEYNESYKNLTFGDGYIIGVHGVQTALYLLNYNNLTSNININDINYGYYDSTTEEMIKTFQSNNNIDATGVLTQETWNALYDNLITEKGIILAVTGEKQLTIVDADEMIDNNNENKEHITNGSVNYDDDNNKNHITNNGRQNFSSSGEFTTKSDSLGGQDFGGKTSNVIAGDNEQTINLIYGNGYKDNEAGTTNEYYGNHLINGSDYYDTLKYNYIMAGNKSLVPNYTINMPNSNRWNGTSIKDIDTGGYRKDYDFIYNLLANTSYGLDGYVNQQAKSNSTEETITDYAGEYENSSNRPFFSPENLLTLRRSRFDIDLVYGAKGTKSRKIINVVPMSVSQEVNASGEPIYDVYEFIAQDVIYSDDFNITNSKVEEI